MQLIQNKKHTPTPHATHTHTQTTHRNSYIHKCLYKHPMAFVSSPMEIQYSASTIVFGKDNNAGNIGGIRKEEDQK